MQPQALPRSWQCTGEEAGIVVSSALMYLCAVRCGLAAGLSCSSTAAAAVVFELELHITSAITSATDNITLHYMIRGHT